MNKQTGNEFNHLEHTKDEFIKIANSQEQKGIEKYGQPLDPLDSYNWRRMAKEEAVDLFKYLEAEEEKTSFITSKIRELSANNCNAAAHDEIAHWLDILEGK